jgi:hypothetical protein
MNFMSPEYDGYFSTKIIVHYQKIQSFSNILRETASKSIDISPCHEFFKNNWIFCFQNFVFPVKINLCCHVYECKATLKECPTKIKEYYTNFRFFFTGVFIEKYRVFCKPGKVQKTGLKTA